MKDKLRSKVIRLAYHQPSLRPHLLPLLKSAAEPSSPKGSGVLYVEREGTRPVLWKENVTAEEAASLVEDWENLFEKAEDGDKGARAKLRSYPMKEGMDAVFVDSEAESWINSDGWEYAGPASESSGAKLPSVVKIIGNKG